MKPIPIYLTSYYFSDVIVGVINRLNEVTKTPFKIIVGDNLSKNSIEIREKLLSLKKEKKVDTIYMYNQNHGLKIIKHMIEEEKNDEEFIVFGDGDALINKVDNLCWLEDFLKILQNNNNIGLVGFQSKNEQIPVAVKNEKLDSKSFEINCDKIYTLYDPEEVLKKNKKGQHTPCPVRAHFITIRRKLLNAYYEENIDNGGTYDGGLQRFLAKKKYLIAKYICSFTYNLGTIKSGYDCDGLSIEYPPDLGYIEIRKTKTTRRSWDEMPYPKTFQKV